MLKLSEVCRHEHNWLWVGLWPLADLDVSAVDDRCAAAFQSYVNTAFFAPVQNNWGFSGYSRLTDDTSWFKNNASCLRQCRLVISDGWQCFEGAGKTEECTLSPPPKCLQFFKILQHSFTYSQIKLHALIVFNDVAVTLCSQAFYVMLSNQTIPSWSSHWKWCKLFWLSINHKKPIVLQLSG